MRFSLATGPQRQKVRILNQSRGVNQPTPVTRSPADWHYTNKNLPGSVSVMKVFVTGAGSHFAQALLPVLCEDASISRVTGLDTERPDFAHPKFTAFRHDLRDAAVAPLLAGHDALVHLAFIVLRGRLSADEMFDANVRAGQKLFHAARAAGIKRLVHMSSAAVYGSAVHANEQTPLKPLPGCLYAEHQAQFEQLLAIEFPECVRLRPHVILGPHAHPAWKRLLRQPFYVRMAEPHPLLQCIHEEDLARAVALSLGSEARGAYNLAVEGSFSFRDAIRARHRVSAGLPPAAARGAMTFARRFLSWDIDPAWLEALSHTLLVNCRRAIIELGWRSRHSAHDAIAAT